MKERIVPTDIQAREVRAVEPIMGLTPRSYSPYAKDGKIVFMSDKKINELIKEVEDITTANASQEGNVAIPDAAMTEFKTLFDEWKANNPQAYDIASARTNAEIKKMGLQFTPETVKGVADMTEDQRIELADKMLREMGSEPLTDAQKQAILEAHYEAWNNLGKNGEVAGVYNYTPSQLLKKARYLRDFTPQQREVLMKAGITGTGDAAEGTGFASSGTTFGGSSDMPYTDGGISFEGPSESAEEMLKSDAQKAGVLSSNEKEAHIAERIQNMNSPKALKELINKNVKGQVERIAHLIAKPPESDRTKQGLEFAIERLVEPYEHRLNLAVDSIDEPGGLENAKQVAQDVIAEIFKRERDEYWANYDPIAVREHAKHKENQINNMIDVAESIMQTDPGRWGTYKFNEEHGNRNKKGIIEAGEFPLLNEDGSVNQQNFIRWVREKMVEQHEFDPDSPINFFSAVSVENPNVYRQINLQTMTQNPGIYFKDKNGEVLKELRDEVVNLAWLGGTVRNMDVQYRQEMSNDSRFADMLVGLFKSNTFGKENTKGINTLASLFTMDEEYNSGDMKLGTAMRSAYLMYYHITDPEKVRSLFPEDFTLYSKSEMEAVITKLRGDASEEEFLKEAGLEELWSFYENGQVAESKVKEFASLMNVFNPPTKNRTQTQVFRKLISRVAAKHAGLTLEKDGFVEVDERNADFPELMAYLMTYWTGAASRQDTTFAALNAFTKTEHFKGYLYKQADPSRAGGIGNARQIELLNKITVDPMLGILTTENKTTLELLEKMQLISSKKLRDTYTEEDRKKELEEIRRTWVYGDKAWSQYAPQHVGNGFKEFHDRTTGKQVKFESFVHYEMSTGRYVYDTDKMISEVQEAIIKPTRYRWSTHKIDYAFEQRVLKVEGDLPEKKTLLDKFRWSPKKHAAKEKKSKVPEYETKTTAEAMFGPQVLLVAQRILMHEEGVKQFLDSSGKVLRHKVKQEDGSYKEVLTDEAKDALSHKEFGRVVSKAYLICKFATMLYYNTTRSGPGHLLDIPTRELIIHGLGSITAGVAGDPEDFRNTEVTKKYFTDFDLNILRELSDNEQWKNDVRHATSDLLVGGTSGAGKSLKIMAKEMFKF